MNEALPVHRRLYAGWMGIVARFGYVQTLMTLGLFYATLIGLVGVGLTVARRDLLAKGDLWSGGSAWTDADSATPDLDRAKRLA